MTASFIQKAVVLPPAPLELFLSTSNLVHVLYLLGPLFGGIDKTCFCWFADNSN